MVEEWGSSVSTPTCDDLHWHFFPPFRWIILFLQRSRPGYDSMPCKYIKKGKWQIFHQNQPWFKIWESNKINTGCALRWCWDEDNIPGLSCSLDLPWSPKPQELAGTGGCSAPGWGILRRQRQLFLCSAPGEIKNRNGFISPRRSFSLSLPPCRFSFFGGGEG